MLHQILAPLDGSALAEQALPWVNEIAALTSVTVTLVQVVEPTDAAIDLLALQPAMERAAHDYLAQTAQQLAQDRMTVHARVVVGRPAEQIIQLAHSVDLIVMATHGRSGVGRWVYGSVADKVLTGAPVPVLLIHVRPAQARPAQPLRRILIPLDGSALAERALPLASWLAQRAGAELVVIRSTEWDRAVAAIYVSVDTVAAEGGTPATLKAPTAKAAPTSQPRSPTARKSRVLLSGLTSAKRTAAACPTGPPIPRATRM